MDYLCPHCNHPNKTTLGSADTYCEYCEIKVDNNYLRSLKDEINKEMDKVIRESLSSLGHNISTAPTHETTLNTDQQIKNTYIDKDYHNPLNLSTIKNLTLNDISQKIKYDDIKLSSYELNILWKLINNQCVIKNKSGMILGKLSELKVSDGKIELVVEQSKLECKIIKKD